MIRIVFIITIFVSDALTFFVVGKRPPTKRTERARHLGVRVMKEADFINYNFRSCKKGGKDRRRRVRPISPSSSSSSSSSCSGSPRRKEVVTAEERREEEMDSPRSINPEEEETGEFEVVFEERDVPSEFAEFLQNTYPHSNGNARDFVNMVVNFRRSFPEDDIATLSVVAANDDLVVAEEDMTTAEVFLWRPPPGEINE